MAATANCGTGEEGRVQEGEVRILAAYPPTGGTGRNARGRPGFAKAEDALAEFLLQETEANETAGRVLLGGMDANAIRAKELDSIGTSAEPREASVLCRAMDEGGGRGCLAGPASRFCSIHEAL